MLGYALRANPTYGATVLLIDGLPAMVEKAEGRNPTPPG
jgi:hypothetical protein